MELSATVEWAVHCAWLLAQAPEGGAVPTRRLAEFHGIPQDYLAKALQELVRTGILHSTSGPRGGYRLGREAAQITVWDIVAAVDGARPLFRCQEIRRNGPCPLAAAECRRPCGVAAVMHRAEQAWRDELAATSIADLVSEAGTGSVSRAAEWFARDGSA